MEQSEQYIPPELFRDLPKNNALTADIPEAVGVDSAALIKQFLRISKDMGLSPEDRRRAVNNPVEYFSDSFDGVISEQHIIFFLQIANQRLGIPKDDALQLGIFLRDYNKHKMEQGGAYSTQDKKAGELGIRYLEEFLLRFRHTDDTIADTEKENAAISLSAYLTNWLTKMKLYLCESSEENEKIPLQMQKRTLEMLYTHAEQEATRLFVNDPSANSLQVTTELEQNKVSKRGMEKRMEDLADIEKEVRQLSFLVEKVATHGVEDIALLRLLASDVQTWAEYVEHVRNNADQFSAGTIPDDVQKLFQRIEKKVLPKDSGGRKIIEIMKILLSTVDATSPGQTNTLQAQEKLREDIKQTVEEMERMVYSFDQNAFALAMAEIRHRDESSSQFPAADLYFTKGVLSCLYVINKSREMGISFEDLAKGMLEGNFSTVDIKQGKTNTRNISSIYFDTGIALHYPRDQVLGLLFTAKYLADRQELPTLE